MKLQDRRAIVTGGGRGIGRAYVERFLDEGAQVAILDLDIERAEKTAAELADRGTVFALQTDIGDEESVDAGVAAVAERFGGLDIVVNNAAIFGDWKPRDDTFEYLKKITDVNLLGAWLVTRAAAPHLVKSPHGRVINQSSTNAYSYNYSGPTDEFPGLRSYSYAWTKYGTNGLTKYTAAQLGNWGVTVNAIAPGVIFTEALLNAVDEERANQLVASQPIKGKIQASDIAGAAAFLASDDAKFISGQVLLVDGGRFMPG
ncbi:SDR family NAD(P)-dependent oxidoreductase [Pseudonocardia parietis]|uniref:3-oxoacyl-[acyl-carrier protein] reductase n=1 Tax=Pseudonocardia parietis TaxID=570936 RepID=A0ABS4VSL9_9PSEU|nr:SDR family NAD(P)-dependent oxidoreductase [Pseudonocardia parietis]MBP2366895.1 3-oxoacyl-[acyl-carrier protein] reductase [Pseudonocardia parietis]